MIIAIDGPSASGKSTVAKLIAQKLKLNYIDTGAMYRTVTLAYYNQAQSGSTIDEGLLAKVLSKTSIKFAHDKVLLNGQDVSQEIRSSEISNRVSDIAAIKEVREKLVSEQQKMGEAGNVILDGRDIGSVVFPNADLKIFLVASAKVRAQRRIKDLEKLGEKVDLEKLTEEISLRDKKDFERRVSPLIKTPDAIEINTDNLTIEEVVSEVLNLC